MDIGLPKEIKNNENRVGLTPTAVAALVKAGHKVYVQKSAGVGSGFSDAEYTKARAKIVNTAAEAWNHKMVVKVKEPLESEYKYFKPNMILFTYLHLADNRPLTDALIKSRVCGIAYETMIDKNAKVRLPLLAPMSRVAGRRSAIIAATFLESHRGGLGLLPGGVEDNDVKKPSTEKGLFLVIGGGGAGYSAATMAAGMGANVTILEANPERIQQLKRDGKLNTFARLYGSTITVENAKHETISKWIKQADALISTVLIPGAKAPKVVSANQVKTMKKGSILIDIAIDQGGSIQTIDRVTTHDKPVYVKYDANHYAVANMPGATPRTSTAALVNATTKFAIEIANKGFKSFACPIIFAGVNTFNGSLTNESVAKALNLGFVPINIKKI